MRKKLFSYQSPYVTELRECDTVRRWRTKGIEYILMGSKVGLRARDTMFAHRLKSKLPDARITCPLAPNSVLNQTNETWLETFFAQLIRTIFQFHIHLSSSTIQWIPYELFKLPSLLIRILFQHFHFQPSHEWIFNFELEHCTKRLVWQRLSQISRLSRSQLSSLQRENFVMFWSRTLILSFYIY